MSENKPLIAVQDKRIILSTLWIVVMFCITFADIIGFIEPGTLETIINRETGFDLTPPIIVGFSLFQSIPILMIVVSRLFRRDVNRWLNIVAALLTLLYVVGGGNYESASYPVFLTIEVIVLLTIIWQAWGWKDNGVV